jgi:hypothetical protein
VWILEGLTVHGTVTVESEATLHATNVVITGRVECSNDSAVSLVSCVVRGSLLSLPGGRSPGVQRFSTRPGERADATGRTRNGDAADSRPQLPDPPSCAFGQVHLIGTTVHADIRGVATAGRTPRPKVLLGPGAVVRGCVLVAGVDVFVDGATMGGPVWRTDADPVAGEAPLRLPPMAEGLTPTAQSR